MDRSMAHHYSNDVFVLVHGKGNPTDQDWDLYLADLRQHAARADCIRTLVFTEGGGPDGFQRNRLNQILGGRPTRAAVLSNSTLARAIVGILAVFNPRISAFSPDDSGVALAYLQVPFDQYGKVLQTLAELKRVVGMGDSAAPEACASNL